MKKTMTSAYTDMMTNLAKSTSAIPLHLQGATGALAWWESTDSLLAKAQIDETDELKKSSAEHETDEAYEEDEQHEDAREESTAENDVHGGGDAAGEGDDEADESEEDEGEMEKALAKDPQFAWHKQAAGMPHAEKMKFIADNPFPGTQGEYRASREAFETKSTKMAARKLNKQAYASMSEYSETGDPAKHKDALRLATLAKETKLGKAMSELDEISSAMLAKADMNTVALAAAVAPAIPGIAMLAHGVAKTIAEKKKGKAAPAKVSNADQHAPAAVPVYKLGAPKSSLSKAVAELDEIASAMLEKGKKSSDRVGDQFLPGQMEMFGDAPPATKTKPAKVKPTPEIAGQPQPDEDPYTVRPTLSWRGEHPVKGGSLDLGKALGALDDIITKLG